MLKKISLFFIALVPFNTMQAMKEQSSTASVSIVDYNAGESVNLGQSPATITVFGSTPRYSMYENFNTTLQSDINELATRYKPQGPRGKCLKGAAKKARENLSNLVDALANVPQQNQRATKPTAEESEQLKQQSLAVAVLRKQGIEKLTNFIHHGSDKDHMKLFFKAGLNTETFKHNVQHLCDTIHALHTTRNVPAQEHLFHILLPLYFEDAPTLKEKSELAHIFLKKAASTYKQLYTQTLSNSSLKVHLVIPPLHYFVNTIKEGPQKDRHVDTTLKILHEEIIGQLQPNHHCILVDHNKNELQELLNRLDKKEVRIYGHHLPLHGFPKVKFTPYRIPPHYRNNHQDYPEINEGFKDFVQKKLTGAINT